MADFPERNLKTALRFALRFLKVRPRHQDLSPKLPRFENCLPGSCPHGFKSPPWGLSPKSRGACPQKPLTVSHEMLKCSAMPFMDISARSFRISCSRAFVIRALGDERNGNDS